MANISQELSSRWLGVVDMDGEETIECRIKSIDMETLTNPSGPDEDKWVATLESKAGKLKPMILNKTNLRNLSTGLPHMRLAGFGPETNDWAGMLATLYFEMANNPQTGKQVPGLRIRPAKAQSAPAPAAAPAAAAPAPAAGDEFNDDIPF
jgi:hypothetical protein